MLNLYRNLRLEEQFERRQKAFKPNMDIKLTPPYLVDGVLTGAYVPPDEDNCIEMECFDLPAWQEVLHGNESDCP